jgi:hypothetical protein
MRDNEREVLESMNRVIFRGRKDLKVWYMDNILKEV